MGFGEPSSQLRAPTGRLHLFDTERFPDAERLHRWSEFICGRPDRVAPVQPGQAPFKGTIVKGTVGRLSFLHIKAGPHTLSVPHQPATNRSYVRIVVQVRGEATLSQGGAEVLLQPGHWTIWFTDRAHVVTNQCDVEQFAFFLPKDLLGLSPANILRYAGIRLGEYGGIGRMVPQFIMNLFDQVEAVAANHHDDLADIASHHIRLALDEVSRFRDHEAIRDTMRTRVIDYIRHNLRDPDLSVERIAESFGCSKRNIHKIFSGSGMTISQFLWNERLDRCRAALANPDMADHSVTEISFMWGFNESSHFSRLFKARFGEAPGRWRMASVPA